MKMLFEYGWILVLVVILALYFYMIYKKKGLDAMLIDMREKAYMLMLWAENKLGPDGAYKFNFVLDKVYLLMPKSLQLVLSKEQLAVTLQDWYDDAKDFLDNGIMDNSTGGA